MSTPTSTRTIVYNEGRQSFIDGDDLYACPYTGYYFDIWVKGYNSAQDQH